MGFKFTIIDYTNTTAGDIYIVNEPVGFDTVGMRLKRDKTWHGFFDFFDDAINNMQWHDTARDVLKAAYDANGIDAECDLLLEYACSETDTFETVYLGRFVFTRYAYVCGDMCYVECGVENKDCLMTFRNRYDQKVDLDSLNVFDHKCTEDDSLEVGGEFTAATKIISITSVTGFTPEDLTGLKKGNQITITNTAGNNGTYTIVEVILGTTTTIEVEETLVDAIDASFTIAGCLILFTLPAYDFLNKPISIPPKKILQTNNWAMAVPYSYSYIDDLLDTEAVGTAGVYYFVLPFDINNQTEISTSNRDFFSYFELTAAPTAPLESLMLLYDGYVKIDNIPVIECTGRMRIKLRLLGDLSVDTADTITFTGTFVLYYGNDNTGYTTVALQSGFGCLGCSSAGDTIDIDYDDYINVKPGDRIYVRYSMVNTQYLSGGGGGGPTDPFQLEISITEGSLLMEYESICEDTPAKMYLVNEALSRTCEIITNDCMRVKSDFFGRVDSQPYQSDQDGCGSMEALTSGIKIRAKENDSIKLALNEFSTKFFTSMKSLFDGLNAIHNIGMGVETDTERSDGSDWIRVEPVKYFYDDAVLLTCYPAEVRRTVKSDLLYSILKFGYQRWETESYNGLNDLFGNREYRTTLKSIRNTYDRLCQFIASDYAIEVTRRQFGGSTKDWRYDNETFIFCLTNKFCATVQFLSPHGILIMDIDDPLRWNIGDEITITGSASNDGTYTINLISTEGGNTLLTVDESITTEIDAQCCFENTTTPFRIVEQGNVASDTGVMFAEYCLNLRITPARTALNHLHTVLTSYRNHLLGEMKFSSGNGNYIASIELSVVDCALEGAQALAENQDLSLDVVADAEENAPLLESEEITFDYPITYAQYKTIKANPYGLIGFSCGNQPTEYGWIQDFQYKPYEGMGQFTLVLKR